MENSFWKFYKVISEVWKREFQLMLILGLIGIYFDAAVVFVKKTSILFRLAVAILCWEISSIIYFQAFSMNKFFPPDHFHKPFNNIAFIYHRNVVRHLASSSSLPLCYLSILPTCLISRHPSGHCLFKLDVDIVIRPI